MEHKSFSSTGLKQNFGDERLGKEINSSFWTEQTFLLSFLFLTLSHSFSETFSVSHSVSLAQSLTLSLNLSHYSSLHSNYFPNSNLQEFFFVKICFSNEPITESSFGQKLLCVTKVNCKSFWLRYFLLPLDAWSVVPSMGLI